MKYQIYKIINHSNNLIYVGKTTNKLEYRFAEHANIKNRCRSHLLFLHNPEDCEIELLDIIDTENKPHADMIERYYIEQYACVNKNIPHRSAAERRAYKNKWYKQYRINNMDKIKLAQDKYKLANYDTIKAYQKEYRLKHKEFK